MATATTQVINSTFNFVLTNCTDLPGGCTTESTKNLTTVIHSSTESATPATIQSYRKTCSRDYDNLCLNGGECQYLEYSDGFKQRFCSCIHYFEGPRCEFINYIKMISSGESKQYTELPIGYIFAGIAAVVLVLAALLVAVYFFLKSRRYKEKAEQLETKCKECLSSNETLMTKSGCNTPQRYSSPPSEYCIDMMEEEIHLNVPSTHHYHGNV